MAADKVGATILAEEIVAEEVVVVGAVDGGEEVEIAHRLHDSQLQALDDSRRLHITCIATPTSDARRMKAPTISNSRGNERGSCIRVAPLKLRSLKT